MGKEYLCLGPGRVLVFLHQTPHHHRMLMLSECTGAHSNTRRLCFLNPNVALRYSLVRPQPRSVKQIQLLALLESCLVTHMIENRALGTYKWNSLQSRTTPLCIVSLRNDLGMLRSKAKPPIPARTI